MTRRPRAGERWTAPDGIEVVIDESDRLTTFYRRTDERGYITAEATIYVHPTMGWLAPGVMGMAKTCDDVVADPVTWTRYPNGSLSRTFDGLHVLVDYHRPERFEGQSIVVAAQRLDKRPLSPIDESTILALFKSDIQRIMRGAEIPDEVSGSWRWVAAAWSTR